MQIDSDCLFIFGNQDVTNEKPFFTKQVGVQHTPLKRFTLTRQDGRTRQGLTDLELNFPGVTQFYDTKIASTNTDRISIIDDVGFCQPARAEGSSERPSAGRS